jgi:membrane associated rhomboid family serine protease
VLTVCGTALATTGHDRPQPALRQINDPDRSQPRILRVHSQEQVMFKIAAVVWIMIGTVFAGITIMTILSVPSLADHAISYIPRAAIGGFIVAIPIAFFVARRMARTATR